MKQNEIEKLYNEIGKFRQIFGEALESITIAIRANNLLMLILSKIERLQCPRTEHNEETKVELEELFGITNEYNKKVEELCNKLIKLMVRLEGYNHEEALEIIGFISNKKERLH